MTEIKYIRAKGISKKYDIGLSTVWKYSGNGTLPPPYVKLSKKCTVWNADEVEQAIQKLHNNPNSDNDILNFRAERSEDRKSSEES
jgi:predicted DNA-binding transcriptional regulator AlpA